ncbi:MAG: OsmC family protein [Candidatus Thermoplasmatota archaeon]
MAELRLTVSHTGRGNAIECTTPAGAKLQFDGGEGSPSSGATPMQHLLASVGACALMDVGIILTKKRLAFTNLRVECVGTREKKGETNPIMGVKLVFHVDGDVPQKAFDDAVKLSVEKYCSAGATLAKSTPVAFEAIVSNAKHSG